MPSLSKFIERMDYYCRIVSVGYDWGRRWNVWDGGDTDCSALTITCLKEAGFDTCDASYTGNLSSNLTARGWDRLAPNISDARPGDILLNDANHVAVVLWGNGWGATIGQASIGETGDVYGNQPGDQTGWETNETAIYDYPWSCILRWSGDSDYDDESEEDDMRPADVWEYNWEGSAPGGNMYNCVLGINSKLDELTKKVNTLQAEVKKIKVGGVDIAAVAKAVNDDTAKRMKS